MIRSLLHILTHGLVPGFVARYGTSWLGSSLKWPQIWLMMLATNLVDLDHLLADPIYDPSRCSIGFHPLHSFQAILIYVILMLPQRTRIIGTGLVIHMLLDIIDCFFM